MSEYQYYEFQAIDRPLTPREMTALRALSTRAHITPTSFVNTYNFGDFRGNPAALMERYFDAFLYLANWGSREFMLRLPARVLPARTAAQYCAGTGAAVRAQKKSLIWAFRSEEEGGGDWVSGDGRLASLIPLREEIARGDLRGLYLGWLLCVQAGEVGDAALEPPVPPGLGDLSAPLRAFVDFLRIDPDLIAVAATASAKSAPDVRSQADFDRYLRALPEAVKDETLVRLARGDDPHLRARLLQDWQREAVAAHGVERAATGEQRRTAAALRAAADGHGQERRRREAEQQARERARVARQQAKARASYLEGLSRREEDTWAQVERLVATRQGNGYAEAVRLLVDLRDAAGLKMQAGAFGERLSRLRAVHMKKPTLLRRMGEAGLANDVT